MVKCGVGSTKVFAVVRGCIHQHISLSFDYIDFLCECLVRSELIHSKGNHLYQDDNIPREKMATSDVLRKFGTGWECGRSKGIELK